MELEREPNWLPMPEDPWLRRLSLEAEELDVPELALSAAEFVAALEPPKAELALMDG
jgi:hypothetical protein